MRVIAIFFCLTFLAVQNHSFYFDDNNAPVVELSTGAVKGKTVVTESGNKAFAFFGVPYGENPTGELRFASSVLRQPWIGVLDCTKYGIMCWANATGRSPPPRYPGEDCLTANIFAPQDAILNKHLAKNPIAVFIHGGVWEFSNPGAYDTNTIVDNFVSNGVVFVTIGYRLGALGFWSTGTEHASGNYALKDMILSLQWLRRDIEYFGGTSDSVTIMGLSSGAHAVDLLSVSPAAQGLFHRAVAMSGMGLQRKDTPTDLTPYKTLAEMVNCSLNDDWMMQRFDKITACMRTLDPGYITRVFSQQVPHEIVLPRMDGKGGIIPDWPNKLANRRLPIRYMLGTTGAENSPINDLQIRTDITRQDVADACEKISIESSNGDKNKQGKLKSACMQEYVTTYDQEHAEGTTDYNLFWAHQLDLVMSDFRTYVPTYLNAQSLKRAGSTVYLYSFDYQKQEPFYVRGGKWVDHVPPFHAFDQKFLLGVLKYNYSANDLWFQKNHAKLFAQFAKYGDPTYQPVNGTTWHPMTDSNYFSMAVPFRNVEEYHEEAREFWLSQIDYEQIMLVKNQQRQADSKHWVVYAIGILAGCVMVIGTTVMLKRHRTKLRSISPEMQPLIA